MNRGRIVRFLAPALLLTGFWVQAAETDPLQCQIGGVTQVLGNPPFGVSFQALTAGGDPPLTFQWDFGDGTTSIEQNPYHLYPDPGIIHAVLTVTPNGMSAAACHDTVTLYLGIIIDPYCVESADPTWSETADQVAFTAAPAFLFDPGPYVWHWRFGDGTTRTTESPSYAPGSSWTHGYAIPGTYWAAVTLETPYGIYACFPTSLRITTLVSQDLTAVGPAGSVAGLRLEPARPSPFGIATTLGYALPRDGAVRLAIFDLQGRRVATLVDGVRSAGQHIAVWQGRSDAGAVVPAGVYMAVLEQGGETQSTRLVRVP